MNRVLGAQLGNANVKSCGDVEQRQSYVRQEVENISSAINFLSSVIEHLEGRLDPVMRANQPEGGNSCAVPEIGVPLADDLASSVRRLRSLDARLSSICDRIEI